MTLNRGFDVRAIANGRDEGVTKLLFDDSPQAHGHGKILGDESGPWQVHGFAAGKEVDFQLA